MKHNFNLFKVLCDDTGSCADAAGLQTECGMDADCGCGFNADRKQKIFLDFRMQTWLHEPGFIPQKNSTETITENLIYG